MDWTALLNFLPSKESVLFLSNLMGDLAILQDAMTMYAKSTIGYIAPTVRSLLVIYVMLFGFAMLRGAVREAGSEAWLRVFKIALVVELSLDFNHYNNIVINFISNVPEDLVLGVADSALVSLTSKILDGFPGNTGTDAAVTLAAIASSAVLGIAQDFFGAPDGNAGMSGSLMFALGSVNSLAAMALGGSVAAMIMISRFALTLLVALGPIFIVSLLFERTKGIFDSWINAILTLVLTILMLSMTVFLLFPLLILTVLSYAAASSATLGGAGVLGFKDGVGLVTILGIYISVVRMVPNLAIGLARGAYLTMDVGSWQKSAATQEKNQGAVSDQIYRNQGK